MSKALKILFLEDTAEDAELAVAMLEDAGYSCRWERVETQKEFEKRLRNPELDLVISDYNLRSFDGLRAVKLFVELGLDIPFILVSGVLGEEAAIETLKAGASDFVLKDKMFRLPVVVERALKESEDHRRIKQAENERKVLDEIIQGSITTPNLDEFLKLVHRSIGQIVYAENCFVMLHDPVTDMVSFEFWADKHDPPPPPHMAGKGFGNYVLLTGTPLLLTEETTKLMYEEGEAEEVGSPSPSWLGVPLRTPARTIGVLVVQHYEVKNAYDQRDLEFLSSVGDQIALAIERKRAEEALIESEERYRDLVENAIDMIYTQDRDGNYTSINKAAERITGYTREETLKGTWPSPSLPNSGKK